MSVLDLPTVGKLELEYHFPAYTGLPVQKIEIGGDVAALRGTEVWMKVTPTMASPDGKILVNESGNDVLTKQADGTLTGKFVVKDEGFYKIQLTGPHGEQVDASPKYTIDVLKDQPPVVVVHQAGPRQLGEPGRRSVRRSQGQRRLRREATAAALLGERRRREDDQPVRRREAAAGRVGRPHHLSRGTRA